MSRLLSALALAALLAASAPAQAEAGATVRTIEYDGGHLLGGMAMLYVADSRSAGNPLLPQDQPEPATPIVSLRAARATAWVFTQERLIGPDGSPVPGAAEPVPEVLGLTNLVLDLQDFMPGFQLHMFAADATRPATFSTTGAHGKLWSFGGAAMGPGAWRDEESDASPGGDPVSGTPVTFSGVALDAPALVHTARGVFTLAATGDLYLELFGFTLSGTDDEGARSFATGDFRRPVVGGADVTMLAAAHEERRFVRFLLEGAFVDIGVRDGNPDAHWAAADSQVKADGQVVLDGANGIIESGSFRTEAHGGQVILPAGSSFRLLPGEGSVGFAMASEGSGPTAVAIGPGESATLVGAGAILALLAAIGVGLLRRWSNPPALADVERSIEAGHFRRAARMAGRIRRRSPGSEDAVLARGIALSKSGRNARAVRELQAHLAAKGASDGSLHYVLGLAFLGLGRDDEGQHALREAVRLTPSLAAEVAPRLGAPPAPLPLLPKDAHGYA